MQASAPDRDDTQIDTTREHFPPDDADGQDGFDLWLDLGGSD
jgi:hypothetical protein